MARRSRFSTVAPMICGCLALALLSSCKQEVGSPQAPPVPEVGIVVATAQDVPDEPEFIGQSESSRPVEIRSQVTGILKAWFFKEGRDVKKGDRLYQIDPVPFHAAMLSAKAKVAQAEARLVQAKQNLARVKPLLAEQAVSTKDVDDAVAEEMAAKANLEGAKAELVKAKFDLDNTLIMAPISGMIERTRVYEGRLVSAQTDLLTIIQQVDPMYVIVSAPESFSVEAAARQHGQTDSAPRGLSITRRPDFRGRDDIRAGGGVGPFGCRTQNRYGIAAGAGSLSQPRSRAAAGTVRPGAIQGDGQDGRDSSPATCGATRR